MNRTKIDWADYSWNPITGCTKGCPYCYARRWAKRLNGGKFEPTFHPDRLLEPLKRHEPGVVFTCSMGEFFSPELPDLYRDLVIRVMVQAEEDIFVILTKRADLLLGYGHTPPWLPTNVWFGVSMVQRASRPMAASLMDIPHAATRILCLEPMLEDVSGMIPWFGRAAYPSVDWVIVGGQTGARRFKPPDEWIDRIVRQCEILKVPVFIKDNAYYHRALRQFPERDPRMRLSYAPTQADLEELEDVRAGAFRYEAKLDSRPRPEHLEIRDWRLRDGGEMGQHQESDS